MTQLAAALRSPYGQTRLWPIVAAVAALALVFSQSTSAFTAYQLDLATSLLAFITLAQAWNILAGYGGLVSLGVSAFVGTGAYTVGLLEVHAHVGYTLAVLGALVSGASLAFILAAPLLRLRGDYFSIGTLAAALALQAWMVNWSFAGGSTGIDLPASGVPSLVEVFQLACAVAATAMICAILVARSGFGMRLKAQRDHEAAAVGLGVSVFRHQLTALVISGALSGLAGALLALQQVSFEPNGMLGLSWTVNALIMTVVGGIGTLVGPALGAVVVYYLLTRQLEGFQTVSIIVEGALLVAIVRFAPRGIWPLLQSGARRLAARVPRTPQKGTGSGTAGPTSPEARVPA